MGAHLIIYYFMLIFLSVEAFDLCAHTKTLENCVCRLNTFACPNEFEPHFKASIQTSEDVITEFKLQCDIQHFSSFELPNMNISHVHKIVTSGCFVNLEDISKLGLTSADVIISRAPMLSNYMRLKIDSLPYISNLRILRMEDNSIGEINPAAFHHFYSLEELDLSHNFIKDIDSIVLYIPNIKKLDLSQNSITELKENALTPITRVEELYLSHNHFKELPAFAFRSLSELKVLEISDIGIQIVPRKIFRYNPKIRFINLSRNPLTLLPSRLFSNLKQLNGIDISDCKLIKLPSDLFKNSYQITSLDMSGNDIEYIPMELFDGLENLGYLNLASNAISYLATKDLQYLNNLGTLILRNNRIYHMDVNVFEGNSKLVTLDLSKNSLTDEGILGRLDTCLNLEDVRIDHNYISTVPLGPQHKYIERIDVRHNKFDVIDFQVTSANMLVDFRENDAIGGCGCSIYNTFEKNIEIKSDYLCVDPMLANSTLVMVPEYFVCLASDVVECPTNCTCLIRPLDKSLIIHCSNKFLTTIPSLRYTKSNYYNHTEVRMNGNMLKYGPSEHMGYENVTTLILKDNQLTTFEWVPPSIEVLELQNNRLTYLGGSVIYLLIQHPKMKTLSLYNNPWKCNCGIEPLKKLTSELGELMDYNNLRCGDGSFLTNYDVPTYCYLRRWELLAIFAAVLLLTAFSILIMCCRSKTPSVSESDLIYDIFVSFSHKDYEYVSSSLVPFLERNCHAKVNIHYRDWAVGEYIPKSIADSILKSRRTLVVLSEDFLKSIWAVTELKNAHLQSVRLNQKPIIVVSLDDTTDNNCPKSMKKYLSDAVFLHKNDLFFFWDLKKCFNYTSVVSTSVETTEV